MRIVMIKVQHTLNRSQSHEKRDGIKRKGIGHVLTRPIILPDQSEKLMGGAALLSAANGRPAFFRAINDRATEEEVPSAGESRRSQKGQFVISLVEPVNGVEWSA